MPSDPNDTCPHCHGAFTDTDDEREGYPFGPCSSCGLEFHADCLERHACPERIKAETAALKAWEAGVRGW